LLLSDKLLTSINYPSDLRLLDEAQLLQLAQELRNFIIDVVSVKKDISAPV
jgi:1-deoxy-D-xylulose-5-phosphate synthase